MKRLFIVLLALTSVALTPTALAQDNSTNVSVDAGEDECATVETIDDITRICSEQYDPDTDTVTFVIESDRAQPLDVVDAAQYNERGSIEEQDFRLRSGKNTVTATATSRGGRASVVLGTRSTSYNIPLESGDPIISGPFDGRDAQTAAVGGATSVASLTIFLTVRAVTGRSDEPERIA